MLNESTHREAFFRHFQHFQQGNFNREIFSSYSTGNRSKESIYRSTAKQKLPGEGRRSRILPTRSRSRHF
jgi:hypothetical protein